MNNIYVLGLYIFKLIYLYIWDFSCAFLPEDSWLLLNYKGKPEHLQESHR